MAIDAVSVLALTRPSMMCLWPTWPHPTDVFAVPEDAVAMARMRWKDRRTRRVLQAPLQLAKLFEPNYRDTVIDDSGREVGIADCSRATAGTELRLGQAAAAVALRSLLGPQGQRVSLNVAPATRTRSVVKNRALAAAYAGSGPVRHRGLLTGHRQHL
jgi:hypothetical protein